MKILFTTEAQKQFESLDKSIKQRIKKYLDDVSKLDDPASRGKGLSNNRAGYYRYRVGDYRIICQIIKSELIVVVVKIGHRSKVYD